MSKLKLLIKVGFLGCPSEGQLTLELMSRPPRWSHVQLWKMHTVCHHRRAGPSMH
jgi:hypothetical protein